MNKKIVYFSILLIFLSVLIISFWNKKTDSKFVNEQPKSDSLVTLKSDSVFEKEVFQPENYDFKLHHEDTFCLVDGQKIKLSFTSQLIKSDTFTISITDTIKGKIVTTNSIGLNAIYTFTAFDSSGNQLFQKSIDKNLFKEAYPCGDLALSDAYNPKFIDYLPSFNAYLFKITFGYPDTDIGGSNFILLNKNGKIDKIDFGHLYAGAESDPDISVSNDKSFFINGYYIFKPNNRKIQLYTPYKEVFEAKILNNNRILFIDDSENNIKIFDSNGLLLNKLKIGTSHLFDISSVVICIDKQSNNYYLLDGDNKKLVIIPYNEPEKIILQDISKLESQKSLNSNHYIEFNNLGKITKVFLNSKGKATQINWAQLD